MNDQSQGEITEVFVIVGDYLNACTLDRSISRLFGRKPEIHVISTSGRNMLPKLRRRNFTTFNSAVDLAGETLRNVISQYPQETLKYLLLTSEQWHDALWLERQWLKENNVVCHFGNGDPRLITQKSLFAKILRDKLNYPSPREYDLNNPDEIEFPVILKSNSSFTNGSRQVNKQIINNKDELQELLGQLTEGEIASFIAQQLLDSSPQSNISVAGWYSQESQLLIQTNKILQHPEHMGNGDVVRVMDIDPKLQEMVLRICDIVNYHGPFEMEFIRHQGKFYVLEMNPRFWMQHGLLEVRTGGQLLSLYCNLPTNNAKRTHVIYWFNPIHCFYRFIKFDWRPLPRIWRHSCSPLSIFETLRWIGIHYLRLPI